MPLVPYLGIMPHDQVSELNDLVVDGGAIPLLNDVVGGPALPFLYHTPGAHNHW